MSNQLLEKQSPPQPTPANASLQAGSQAAGAAGDKPASVVKPAEPQPSRANSRRVWVVSFPQGSSLRFPLVCPCCLKPATTKRDIGWTERRRSYTSAHRIVHVASTSLEVPVCAECNAHADDLSTKYFAILIRSVILTTICFLGWCWSLRALAPNCDAATALLPLAFFPPLWVLVFNARIRLRPLHGPHAVRSFCGIKLSGASDLIIFNPLYALLLKQLNPALGRTGTDNTGYGMQEKDEDVQATDQPHYLADQRCLHTVGTYGLITFCTALAAVVLAAVISVAGYCFLLALGLAR